MPLSDLYKLLQQRDRDLDLSITSREPHAFSLGDRIKTLQNLIGVDTGETGEVVDIDYEGNFNVVWIEWDSGVIGSVLYVGESGLQILEKVSDDRST